MSTSDDDLHGKRKRTTELPECSRAQTKRPRTDNSVDSVSNRQASIADFLTGHQESDQSATNTSDLSPTAPPLDTMIEVFKFGHSKRCFSRFTIVSFSCTAGTLADCKQIVKRDYGITEDAKRANVGQFNIDIGICGRTGVNVTTFLAQTEAEWSNVVSRLRYSSKDYMLLGTYWFYFS